MDAYCVLHTIIKARRYISEENRQSNISASIDKVEKINNKQ